MASTLTTLLGVAVAVLLAWQLARNLQRAARRRREAPDRLFARIMPLIENAHYEDLTKAGYPQLTGSYRNLPVRIHPVIDTLATRKLPALWLLVTLPEPLPLRATFDLMMRPAGPTTFSNFDHLPFAIRPTADLPEQAVVRTDDPDHLLPLHVVAPHLDVFDQPRAKEMLLTPKGARLVWHLAEADRVRYGVFRQAEFGDIVLDPDLIIALLDRLIALRQSILKWSSAQ
jgi:hypothetical protein